MAVEAAKDNEWRRNKKGNETGSNKTAGNEGKKFKAKNAGGDMKKHGQHDPYSYLPLRKDMLNKRYDS